jgi:hypothetical protein
VLVFKAINELVYLVKSSLFGVKSYPPPSGGVVPLIESLQRPGMFA